MKLFLYDLLFLFTIFAGMIDFRVPYLNYWDEGAAAVIVLLWFIQTVRNRKKPDRMEMQNWILILCFLVLGLLGNLIRPENQTAAIAVVKDVAALLKFPVVMVAFSKLRSSGDGAELSRHCVWMSRGIILLTSVFALVGYFVDIGVYFDDPGRLTKSFEFYFSHPTFFVSSYVMLLGILIAGSAEKNRWYIALDCMLIFFSHRTKGYVVVAAALVLVIFGEARLRGFFTGLLKPANRKKLYWIIPLLLALGWLIAGRKILTYLRGGMSYARTAMYIVGFQIALDMFPLGSGFGTFASSLSGEYYSGIYEKYGLSEVKGITPETYNYAGDVFWPCICGQFGFFGLILYIKLIFNIIRQQFRGVKNRDRNAALLLVWLYVLFATMVEAYFTNTTGLQLALILNLFLRGDENERADKPGNSVGGL